MFIDFKWKTLSRALLQVIVQLSASADNRYKGIINYKFC